MDMTRAWTIRPHYVPRAVGDDHVLLLTETQKNRLLKGRLYARICAALDGVRTAEQVVDALQAEFASEKIYYALMRLEQRGYIAPVASGVPADEAAFWYATDVDAEQASARLRASAATVLSFGGTGEDARILADALAAAGVSITADEAPGLKTRPTPDSCGPDLGGPDLRRPEPRRPDLQVRHDIVVAVVDDYLNPDLAALHHRMREAKQPWTIVKPIGLSIWIGPIFTADGAACLECLTRRLAENGVAPAAVPASLPTTRRFGVRLAATLLSTWIARGSPPAECGRLVTYDCRTLERERHDVLPHPGCGTCAARRDAQDPAADCRIELHSRQVRAAADGGHRTSASEETLARLEPLTSRLTGIACDIVEDEIAAPGFVHRDARTGASGKGRTRTQARVSCLAESIELYNGTFHGGERRRAARMQDLGADAVHPNDLLLISDRQYASRETLNQSLTAPKRIPAPFDASRTIDWTPVWSLTMERVRWLPTALCYFNYPLSDDHQFGSAATNGGAAGNTIEEAILHGVLELVERDAVAIWWYNRLTAPAVDLDSFDDPFVATVRERYRQAGRSLHVLDLSTDLGIAVAAAVSADADGGRVLLGFGCDLEGRLAVTRALTELSQVTALVDVSLRLGSPVSASQGIVESQKRWLAEVTLRDEPYLLPAPGRVTGARTLANHQTQDLRADVQACVRICAAAGLELLVLDTSRRGVDLATVRVIVPGLRHYYPRLAAGRLYDVPVALGLRTGPLDERDLNARSLFL